MGLVATLRAAMVTGVAAAGDTAITLTYRRRVLGTYDPATDAQSNTETDTVLSTFAYALKDGEVDWFAADTIAQKFILNRDLIGFDPSAQDVILIATEEWEIMSIKTLPGDVGYVITIRKS